MPVTETLNIHYHTKLLIIKALNKYPTKQEAMKALGISDRTLCTKMVELRIYQTKEGNYAALPANY
jgi:hypothetical protein